MKFEIAEGDRGRDEVERARVDEKVGRGQSKFQL